MWLLIRYLLKEAYKSITLILINESIPGPEQLGPETGSNSRFGLYSQLKIWIKKKLTLRSKQDKNKGVYLPRQNETTLPSLDSNSLHITKRNIFSVIS